MAWSHARAPSSGADVTNEQVTQLESGDEEHGNAWRNEQLKAQGSDCSEDLPVTKPEALAWHAEAARRVDLVYRSALAQELSPDDPATSRLKLLKNSVEWIESGRVDLLVLSPTHDSDERAPNGRVAAFDDRVALNESGADYDESDPMNLAGIRTVVQGATAEMNGAELIIVGASSESQDEIADTLIHELQHFCDPEPGGAFVPETPDRDTPDRAPSWVYEQWQSEYRARIMDPITAAKFGDPNKRAEGNLTLTATRNPKRPDVVSGALPPTETIRTAFWNEQQFTIFADMVRDPGLKIWRDFERQEWLAIYGYFAHFFVLDDQFREMAETFGEGGAHGVPLSGGNMVNSIRIDDLAASMQDGDPDDRVLEAASALDATDRTFLSDRTLSKPFWDAASAAMSGGREPLLHQVEQLITSGDPGFEQPTDTYTVVAGDSLSLIAERLLGDLLRWPEIYELNEEDIGPDPDLIEVGVPLRIPSP